jgi:chemotaxis methyl-accepting protein methylase
MLVFVVVDWRCVNLTDPLAVRALGKLDDMFCRNVLTYFGDQTVIESLTEALVPGGLLAFFYRRAS